MSRRPFASLEQPNQCYSQGRGSPRRQPEPVYATEDALTLIDEAIKRARAVEADARLQAGEVASHDDADLHENSLYHMMIGNLGALEKDVIDLLDLKARMRPGKGQGNFGRRITLEIHDIVDGVTEEEIHLVGPVELKILGDTDESTGVVRRRVSYESPIGKALFLEELAVGYERTLTLPSGQITIRIKSLSDLDK